VDPLRPNRRRIKEFSTAKLAETLSSSSMILIAPLVLLVHLIIVPTSDKSGPGVWIAWFTYSSMLILILLTVAPRVPFISNFARLRYDDAFLAKDVKAINIHYEEFNFR
jgi:hypothetical protein